MFQVWVALFNSEKIPWKKFLFKKIYNIQIKLCGRYRRVMTENLTFTVQLNVVVWFFLDRYKKNDLFFTLKIINKIRIQKIFQIILIN